MSEPESIQSKLNPVKAEEAPEQVFTRQRLALIIVGFGNIARHWLQHFAVRLPANIEVCALFNSRGPVPLPESLPQPGYLDDKQLNDQQSKTSQFVLDDTGGLVNMSIQQLVGHYPQVAVLDLTASKTVSRLYPRWVASGAHLISANKYAGSSNPDYYRALRDTLHAHRRVWLYNTTVGAGLPVQRTIQERLLCGDEILALEGNFSGSLSWIFQQYRQGQSFSQWLRAAAELGMTEPDPRIDLSGMDVARKLLILARDSGWQLKLSDIHTENLVPAALREVDIDEFWQHSDALDAYIASFSGERFHYLGRIEKASDGSIHAYARLQEIDAQSTYAHLAPGNANFVIRSLQYDANPLVIQGPGAGKEVTAAGVHSDVLHLAQEVL